MPLLRKAFSHELIILAIPYVVYVAFSFASDYFPSSDNDFVLVYRAELVAFVPIAYIHKRITY